MNWRFWDIVLDAWTPEQIENLEKMAKVLGMDELDFCHYVLEAPDDVLMRVIRDIKNIDQ